MDEAHPDLVHRRADHASGHPVARVAQQGSHCAQPASLPPLFVIVDSAAGHHANWKRFSAHR
jgi:hypothetical protein